MNFFIDNVSEKQNGVVDGIDEGIETAQSCTNQFLGFLKTAAKDYILILFIIYYYYYYYCYYYYYLLLPIIIIYYYYILGTSMMFNRPYSC